MTKTILLTGATDGIGLEAAKMLVSGGHSVLLHGRNPEKLARVEETLRALPGAGRVEGYVADFSSLADVSQMAQGIADRHQTLDVMINNAGVYKTNRPLTPDGMDVRFVVNTIAPYLLTRKLLPLMKTGSRVVNLSSAAQAPVDLAALTGQRRVPDMEAYAQSKLAITMWTRALADELGSGGAEVYAVNPGSLLATKMVKEGFGVAGSDIGIGADILARAALSDEFSAKSGAYFDNDSSRFADLHPAGMDMATCRALVDALDDVLTKAAHPVSGQPIVSVRQGQSQIFSFLP